MTAGSSWFNECITKVIPLITVCPVFCCKLLSAFLARFFLFFLEDLLSLTAPESRKLIIYIRVYLQTYKNPLKFLKVTHQPFHNHDTTEYQTTPSTYSVTPTSDAQCGPARPCACWREMAAVSVIGCRSYTGGRGRGILGLDLPPEFRKPGESRNQPGHGE